MKPTKVRSMSGLSPQRSTSCRSMPGAKNPVQQVTIRWVMRPRSSPASSRSAASVARSGANFSNSQTIHKRYRYLYGLSGRKASVVGLDVDIPCFTQMLYEQLMFTGAVSCFSERATVANSVLHIGANAGVIVINNQRANFCNDL